MSQLEALSSAISLVEKSISACRVIVAIRDFGSDAAQLIMMLRFEAYRYADWARDNHTLGRLLQTHGPVDKPAVPVAIAANAVRASALMSAREALLDALVQLMKTLQAVDGILTKYDKALGGDGQALPSGPEPGEPASVARGVLSAAATNGGAQRDILKAGESFRELKKKLQSKTSLSRRVEFVVPIWREADKERLKGLVQQFKYWNDALMWIAPSPKAQTMELRVGSAVVGSTSSPDRLQSIQAAASSSEYESLRRIARVKEATLGLAEKKEVSIASLRHEISIESSAAGPRRFITTCVLNEDAENQRVEKVLVEWYYYDPKWKNEEVDLANERVEGLVRQFLIDQKPSALPVLDCVGWAQHPRKKDRALLYSLATGGEIKGRPVSLLELLTEAPRQTKTGPSPAVKRPSLADRFRLAAALATGLLAVHTVGWLHKGLNAHSVLFFASADGAIDYSNPYFVGFEFSRLDKPRQISLSLRPSPLDIYRHPDLQRTTAATPFARKHDVYSLGLLLFEIGTWTRLDALQKKANLKPDAFRERVLAYAERDLALHAGEAYFEAARACLREECCEEETAAGDSLVSLDFEDLGIDGGVSGAPAGAATGVKDDDGAFGEFDDDPDPDPDPNAYDRERSSELDRFYRLVVCRLTRCQCGLGALVP